MDVIELPMVTEASEVHPENAKEPMDVALSGMVMDIREVHPENA